ncbi:MAG: Stk1 family PASTA domain-containing Ser/Thr kinase [Oscillospiraceae bacterium]|nr:Stk1 family PASTA domain-containing Ser/Thr kinase [Oscillospiraceae bacterium]
MDHLIGKKLDGRYEVLQLVGVGGMANVYKARDIIDERLTAVKVLREEYASNEEFVRRFKNESKAIAALNHPNIVKVYDVSFSDKMQSIVMEYIDGITLKDYIDQQKIIRWKEAVHFAVQILRALQHAHDKGIVHRDIKPQNIMLLQDGTIKVMDFGIARFARSQIATITDKAIGSVHYISPEQARGEKTDEKTDLYSVGVMLFEMLTGQLPFTADSAVSVAIQQIQSKPKRPRELNPSIPEGLEQITMKAMQKDPARRYQSAAEMLRDIDAFKRDPSVAFAYKYLFAEEEEAQSAARRHREADQRAEPSPKRKRKRQRQEEPDEDVQIVVKTPYLAMLGGIAAAFVLVTCLFIFLMFYFNNPFVSVDEVKLPNFVGIQYESVLNSSKYSDFHIVVEETVYNDEYERGVICEQKPKYPKTVKKGSEVKIKVSSGSQKITIPDFSNQEATQVYTELKNMGLEYIESRINHPSIASGYVIRTDPTKGSEVKSGTVVTVYVSLGAQTVMKPVPDVTGIYIDDAKRILESNGLKVGTVEMDKDSDEPYGTVLSQDPREGDVAASGSFVNLKVSQGDQVISRLTIEVPMPSSIDREVEVSAYLDDMEIRRETINPKNTSTWRPSFSGEGIGRVKIYIDDEIYMEYIVDFDERVHDIDSDYSQNFQ